MRRRWGIALLVSVACVHGAMAQGSSGSSSSSSSTFTPPTVPQPQAQSAFQGSVATQPVTPGVLPLSIKDAILIGLKNNLGIILSGQNVNQAGGQR
ncbi:MAG: hypothetical protein QOH85_95, partial [Acidobacteriaceae bacterium]|nr:hypothetical protein [Acidobacteriaceae bacterium]